MMESSDMKNMVVIKNLPSNMVEEAIIIRIILLRLHKSSWLMPNQIPNRAWCKVPRRKVLVVKH